MKYRKIVLSLFLLASVLASPLISLGSAIPQSPALFETALQFPIAAVDTSMTLVSTTLLGGASLPAGYSCFTVDQGLPNTEYICGTVVGKVASSLIRGIDPLTGNTSDSNLIFSHRRGADVKITDFPVLTLLRNILNGQDTLPGAITYANGIIPINGQDLATKTYVLSLIGGGTTTLNAIVVPGVAGESVSPGQLLFFQTSDARWYKVNSATSSNITNTLLSISQGTSTVGVAISSGVLVKGTDTHQSGLTPGATYYASTTPGALGSATTTRAVAKAINSTSIYFDPYFVGLSASSDNTFTGANTFTGTTTLATTTINGLNPLLSGLNRTFITSTGTSSWTVPAGVLRVKFTAVGPGGGGGGGCTSCSTNGAGSGGSGGGFATLIATTTPGQTVTVFLGTGGTAGSTGNGGAGTSGTSGSATTTIGTTTTQAFLFGGWGGRGNVSSGTGIGSSEDPGAGVGGNLNLSGQRGQRAFGNNGVGGFGGRSGSGILKAGSGGDASGSYGAEAGDNGLVIIEY